MTRADLLSDALDGLVRLAWRQRVRLAAAVNPHDILPSETERAAWVDVLVMADTLAAGSDGKRQAKSDLGTLARCLAALSGVLGGVRFLGQRYETVLFCGRLQLVIREDRL